MSTLWWAGLGIDPATQGKNLADSLSLHIDLMLADSGIQPLGQTVESDGSAVRMYGFGRLALSDVFDRRGERIGFGIECCDEADARRRLPEVRALLDRWGVNALASVWTWSRMEPAHPGPLKRTQPQHATA